MGARTIVGGTRRGLLVCAVLAAGVLMETVAPGMAEAGHQITVSMNHVRVLRLDRPVEKVIVGNSNIADVTVADPKTIVLTGKSFGATNLVLLGKDGDAILDDDVLVSIDEGHTIRMYKQADRTVLTCALNTCEEDSSGAGVPASH